MPRCSGGVWLEREVVAPEPGSSPPLKEYRNFSWIQDCLRLGGPRKEVDDRQKRAPPHPPAVGGRPLPDGER